MSQTKAQLLAPIGVVTAPGLTVTGVTTATSFVGTVAGTASSIVAGSNIIVGVMSATGFAGDFTGTATGIKTSSNLNVGVVTALSFVGDVTGNLTGSAGGLSGTPNVHVGVVTSSAMSGDGSNLTGIAASAFSAQVVTANTANTTIGISSGNNIVLNQSTNTTVSFANTGTTEVISILRKDGTGTVTWPSSIRWNDGTPPTLASSSESNDWNLIKLLTRDSGITWQGWEEAKNEGTFDAFVWGTNWSGALAQNDVVARSSPTQLPGHTWAKAMKPGGTFFYGTGAIKTDGTLWTWGTDWGGSGGRNLGGNFYTSSPNQVGTDTNWDVVLNTYKGMGALKTDGSLWSWGYNLYGFLGQNNVSYYSSPVQIPGTYTDKTDGFAAYAVKTNGTLWTWGGNYKGSFGTNLGSYTLRSSPIQIGSDGDWSIVSSVGFYGCSAVKTNGTMWAWGSNNESGNKGFLGQNDLINYSSPVQIPGTWGKTRTTHTGCSGGIFNIKTDGTLWSWGENYFGMLGHNQFASSTLGGVDYSSPTQVGTADNWSKLAATPGMVFAQKTNGEVWAMGGYNGAGQGGLNFTDPTGFSSPTQLPGTDWNVMDNNIQLGPSVMMRKLTN